MSRPAQEETYPVHPSGRTEREEPMDNGLQDRQERQGQERQGSQEPQELQERRERQEQPERRERQERPERQERQERAPEIGQWAALRRLASAYPVAALFAVWYSIGFLLLVFAEVPKPLEFSNGVFLVLYALCLCELAAIGIGAVRKHQEEVLSRPVGWSRLALSAAGIAAGTFAVEYAGVHTGFPFGSYRYENTLGSLLGGVPWTMGLAWVGVVLNGALLSGSRGRLARALETGAWVVLLDLVLDPVAEARGFWHWQDGGAYYGIPAANFAGWFVVGALLSLLLPSGKVLASARLAALRVMQGMLLLFGLLAAKAEMLPVFLLSLLFMAAAEGRVRFDSGR